jgi:hypothetical protein
MLGFEMFSLEMIRPDLLEVLKPSNIALPQAEPAFPRKRNKIIYYNYIKKLIS